MSDSAPFATRSDPCARRAYQRWHYRQNKDLYRQRAKAQNLKTRAAIRGYVLDYLRGHPCVDCGEADPVVLEFDHREGTQKRFNIGNAVTDGYGLSTVIAEIAKCDVRCANCHRRETYRRAGHRHRGGSGGQI